MKNLALIVNKETVVAMHSSRIERSSPVRGKKEPLHSRTDKSRRESLSENYVGELDAWFQGA